LSTGVSTESIRIEEAVVDKDRVEGKVKEVEGKLTDDESREAEGKLQGEYGEKKDEAKGAWENLKDKVGSLVTRDKDEKHR
jgi:uncharacterized protein YjbJ (UPF0337 family)